MSVPAPAWVVAGPPGAGKSTVADLLLAALEPTPALLDKDTMYASFVTAVLATAGRPPGEREGPWYDEHVKVHEYAGMAATAREIRAHGCRSCCPARSPGRSTTDSGGAPGRPNSAAAPSAWSGSGRTRPPCSAGSTARGLGRDAAKLAEFERFCASMRLGTEPAAPHVTVDNRLTATAAVRGTGGRPGRDS